MEAPYHGQGKGATIPFLSAFDDRGKKGKKGGEKGGRRKAVISLRAGPGKPPIIFNLMRKGGKEVEARAPVFSAMKGRKRREKGENTNPSEFWGGVFLSITRGRVKKAFSQEK